LPCRHCCHIFHFDAGISAIRGQATAFITTERRFDFADPILIFDASDFFDYYQHFLFRCRLPFLRFQPL
jgi:hypothetical protein